MDVDCVWVSDPVSIRGKSVTYGWMRNVPAIASNSFPSPLYSAGGSWGLHFFIFFEISCKMCRYMNLDTVKEQDKCEL